MILRISILFFLANLLSLIGCKDTITNEWHLAPANGGVGTWTGDTIIAFDTFAVELITGKPGDAAQANGKQDYTVTISVNDSVKVREGGKWSIDPNEPAKIKFVPEYNSSNNLNLHSNYINTDSTMHWNYIPSASRWIRIPIRLR